MKHLQLFEQFINEDNSGFDEAQTAMIYLKKNMKRFAANLPKKKYFFHNTSDGYSIDSKSGNLFSIDYKQNIVVGHKPDASPDSTSWEEIDTYLRNTLKSFDFFSSVK